MKWKRGFAVLAVGLWIGSSAMVQSQDAQTRWYLRVDAGASHVMEVDVEEFLVPTPGGEMEFDFGTRFGVAGGYQLLSWLAAEIETGGVVNGVDRFNGESIDATLMQASFMANVVMQCDHLNRFVPVVGGGVGGVASILTVDQWFTVGEELLWLDGTDSDLVFAVQAFAGLRYDFHPQMGFGLMYRFLTTDGPSWKVENRLRGEELRVRFGDLVTHAVTAQFSFRF
jgi:opacity protein-like surface antigen